MKFAFKSIVVAAAFVAAGAANAALVTLSGDQVTGTGALTFSSALTSALNTGKVSMCRPTARALPLTSHALLTVLTAA